MNEVDVVSVDFRAKRRHSIDGCLGRTPIKIAPMSKDSAKCVHIHTFRPSDSVDGLWDTGSGNAAFQVVQDISGNRDCEWYGLERTRAVFHVACIMHVL